MQVVDGKCKITLNAVNFEGLLSSIPDHSAAHEYGGSDVIKIDDLGAPDDNTDLNASTSKHGLCPKGTGTGTKYLKDDLTWTTISIDGGTPATAVNTIQFRRATSAQLANGNPVLAAGEPAF
ncbi:MAG: hypothetical protein PHC31_12350, partial [Clostridia bacterium]|nr:hypothetical protein [Clostridia bacterium]